MAYRRLFVGTFPSKGAGQSWKFRRAAFCRIFGFLSHQYKAKCDSFLEELEVAVRKLFGGG